MSHALHHSSLEVRLCCRLAVLCHDCQSMWGWGYQRRAHIARPPLIDHKLVLESLRCALRLLLALSVCMFNIGSLATRARHHRWVGSSVQRLTCITSSLSNEQLSLSQFASCHAADTAHRAVALSKRTRHRLYSPLRPSSSSYRSAACTLSCRRHCQ